MWLYIFCIIVEDKNGWLSQDGWDGLKVEGESCCCIFCIIVEDMNGWLSQLGGDRFKVEGESCGCLCFVLL